MYFAYIPFAYIFCKKKKKKLVHRKISTSLISTICYVTCTRIEYDDIFRYIFDIYINMCMHIYCICSDTHTHTQSHSHTHTRTLSYSR